MSRSGCAFGNGLPILCCSTAPWPWAPKRWSPIRLKSFSLLEKLVSVRIVVMGFRGRFSSRSIGSTNGVLRAGNGIRAVTLRLVLLWPRNEPRSDRAIGDRITIGRTRVAGSFIRGDSLSAYLGFTYEIPEVFPRYLLRSCRMVLPSSLSVQSSRAI